MQSANAENIGKRNGKFSVKLKWTENARRTRVLSLNWKIETGTKLVNNKTICELPVELLRRMEVLHHATLNATGKSVNTKTLSGKRIVDLNW